MTKRKAEQISDEPIDVDYNSDINPFPLPSRLTESFWRMCQYQDDDYGIHLGCTGVDDTQALLTSWPVVKARRLIIKEGLNFDPGVWSEELRVVLRGNLRHVRSREDAVHYSRMYNAPEDIRIFASYMYQMSKDMELQAKVMKGTLNHGKQPQKQHKDLMSNFREEVKAYCKERPGLRPSDFAHGMCHLDSVNWEADQKLNELELCWLVYREHVHKMESLIEFRQRVKLDANFKPRPNVKKPVAQVQIISSPAPTIETQVRSIGTQAQVVSVPHKTFRTEWKMDWNTKEVNDLLERRDLLRFIQIKTHIELGALTCNVDCIKEAIIKEYRLVALPSGSREQIRLDFTALYFCAEHQDPNEHQGYRQDLLQQINSRIKDALTNGKNGTFTFGCRLMTDIEA